MNSIKTFANSVKEEIERNFLSSVEVRISEILKNNGVCLTGLSIIRQESNISPTIYLNDLYKEYQSGNMSITGAAAMVMEAYEKNRPPVDMDMSFFADYEQVKGMLFCKLINYENNRKLLDEVPYRTFLDLAIVPYCLLRQEALETNGGTATILIRNNHLECWNRESDEVLSDALENTRRLQKNRITDIKTVLKDMSGIMVPDDCMMYVMTNENKQNGAICMTDTETIAKFSESIHKDLFVIPSSIHEVILVPTDDDKCIDFMNEMVASVNDTELLPEEVLSDHVYYFSCKEGYRDPAVCAVFA
ncbi:MAG: DUF5688 family protein [Lachnospiraceae bacterium]|nr:DUF5688 family protein [Lachnospiraceae bacterium]